jgi:hypothetical protein
LDSGLPDFLGPKYQNGEKYTKLPQNIPNGHKIFQMVIKYTKIFPLQDPTNFTQIGIFGLKTNHLATLVGFRPNFVLSLSYPGQRNLLNLTEYQHNYQHNYHHMCTYVKVLFTVTCDQSYYF